MLAMSDCDFVLELSESIWSILSILSISFDFFQFSIKFNSVDFSFDGILF